jgi:hypothetical protein
MKYDFHGYHKPSGEFKSVLYVNQSDLIVKKDKNWEKKNDEKYSV